MLPPALMLLLAAGWQCGGSLDAAGNWHGSGQLPPLHLTAAAVLQALPTRDQLAEKQQAAFMMLPLATNHCTYVKAQVGAWVPGGPEAYGRKLPCQAQPHSSPSTPATLAPSTACWPECSAMPPNTAPLRCAALNPIPPPPHPHPALHAHQARRVWARVGEEGPAPADPGPVLRLALELLHFACITVSTIGGVSTDVSEPGTPPCLLPAWGFCWCLWLGCRMGCRPLSVAFPAARAACTTPASVVAM